MTEPPEVALGRPGLEGERPPQLIEQLISLREVVLLAGGDDIRPFMTTTAALGDHVIDGVGRGGAVGASTAVPPEHGPTGERRGPRPSRDLDHVEQTDNRRHLYNESGRAHHRRFWTKCDRLGATSQHQDDRPAIRDEGKGLIGRVEQEDTTDHAAQRYRRGGLTR